MDKQKILSVVNLNKYFVKSGKFVQVLDNVSFDVYKNDFFGIIGESGSGKSTTGKCIIRLYSSSSGIIEFDNKIINQKITKANKKWLTRNMSMVFQDPMSSLNPKKTILSIISEPLIINKVITKDIKEIIKTSLKVNSYFKLTYQIQDYEITKQYLEVFYSQAIEGFKWYIDYINQFNANEVVDHKVKCLNFLTILSELESYYKRLIPWIYAYNKAIADLLWLNHEKLINKDVSQQEQDYYKYKNEYEQNKQLSEHSSEYLETIKVRDDLILTLEEIKSSLSEQYYAHNKEYLISIINNLKNEIKINKQNKQLTSSITEYLVLKIKIMIAQEMLAAINLIKEQAFFDKQELDSFLSYLFSTINAKYDQILAEILSLSRLSNQIDHLSIQNNNKEEIIHNINIYNEQYHKILVEITNLESSPKVSQYEQTIQLKNQFMDECNNLKEKKSTIVDFYQATINKINERLNQINEEYKQSSEYKDNLKLIEESKIKLENANIQRQNLVDTETKQFNEYWLGLIKQQKVSINQLHKQFFELQKQYKKTVKAKTKQIIDYLKTTKNDANSDAKYWIDFLSKETKAKFVNIQAINFELFTYLDEINIYRLIRTTNRFKLEFLKKPLKTIIIRKYVYNALTEVGLKNEHAYRYPHEFSGGQRQRIVIARALIMKPKVVIADEPISALDVSIQAQVINIMKRLSNELGITFLFIAHDLSMVHHVCNRLIIMHKGRIVEKGDTNEIFAHPIHPYTKSLIKASPELSKIHVDLASFSTNLDYDKEYESNEESLKFYSVSDQYEHFVFGTNEQIQQWTTIKK